MRMATRSDLSALLLVEVGCEGAPHWSEAVWLEMLMSSPQERVVLLAEQGDEAMGFVVVALVAGVASLESIVARAADRGRGIGRALAAAALRWARNQGAVAMELEVRCSNEAALQLYQGLGFVEQGRRRAYYAAPVEDAVLMGLILSEGGSGTAKV